MQSTENGVFSDSILNNHHKLYDPKMTGLYGRIISHDEDFEKLKYTPLMINDYNVSNPEHKEILDRHLYTHYKETDTIEYSSSCACGAMTNVYDEDDEILCEICHTPATSTTDGPIHSYVWFRAPEGVDRLISPQMYSVIAPYLKVREYNFLEYFLDKDYNPDLTRITAKETIRKINILHSRGLPRGYNNFIKHFDGIMEFLFEANIVDGTRQKREELWKFIQENKQYMFPKYLPIPSKLCFIVESTTSGIYIDKPLLTALNTILLISKTELNNVEIPLDSRSVQRRTFKAIKQYAEFFDTYVKSRLAGKPGQWRRHHFGSRLHFTARGVITSISEPHDMNDLHIPWGVGLQLFKYHIINKLMNKHGFDYNRAINYVYGHVLKYDKLLDDIFKELIAESPEGRILCLLQRNPTLTRGSTQCFGITKIKTDPTVNTISMSVLVLRAPNAD